MADDDWTPEREAKAKEMRDEILEKVSAYVDFLNEEPVSMATAVVMWESQRFLDDGNIGHRMAYSCLTDGSSMSAMYGLTNYTAKYMEHALLFHED